MLRTVLLLAGVLVCVVALGSDSPKEYDDATMQVDELQGTWQGVAVEIDGSRARAPKELAFRSGAWQISEAGPLPLGRYMTEAGRKPAHLDMRGANETVEYIYRIDGETLRMARTKNGTPRPKSFDDKDLVTFTFKRVRK
jgi:uncharacterized protein (TIGR03067 family)